ncbi:MAG TPA: SMI1/KNR4 family protein [Candidatus Limnocylindrales bacterium]|nr:SMI1/KNR4 family protein [Candidatus Limnocylindrales bacterium]
MSPTTMIELLASANGSMRPGASESDIEEAEAQMGRRLPEDLRSFLRWSDGWEGTFGDTWLVLESAEQIVRISHSSFREAFPGFIAIGGNGGLEVYALDYRGGDRPTGIYAIDPNSLDEQDAWLIGPSVTASLWRLLVQPHGPWE